MTAETPFPDDICATLFAPKSVAVVGASADPTKTGGRPVHYLQNHGFTGAIYPVNPKVEKIAGLTCYASVSDLPEAPDVAIVLLGAARAADAVRDLAARGTRVAIVLASGFAEAGASGVARQDNLRAAAGDMRILGPNTIGAINLADAIVLSASGALEGEDLPVGAISVASQSGGILGALLSRGAARGIGFRRLASTGNELDLDIADLIDHYVRDPDTRVIAAYVEGIRSVDRFRAAAERARAAGKPLVVFKVGRSESGARAAVSHTGAMAGEDRVYDALFRQVGAIRAQTFSDLLDVPAMLATGRRMAGPRVAVLTSTGGAGSLIADSCGVAGLDVPELDAATAVRLQEILGEEAPMTGNPVDVTLAGVKPDIMTAATEALLTSESVDGVAVVVGSSALAQPEIAVGAIRAGAARSDKPLIAYVSPHAPHIALDLNRQGIPAFTAPETCATAFLAASARSGGAAAAVASAAPIASNLSAGPMDEMAALGLFADHGIHNPGLRRVTDAAGARAAAAELGGRVVLKVLSSKIAHKSDVGGVKVGLTPDTVGPALEDMARGLAAQGLPHDAFLVAGMVGGGVELIAGVRRDPQLGPMLLLGAGGVLAELTDDTAIRLLPITHADAEEMVAELAISKLLAGYRGAAPHDVPALVDAVMALGQLAASLGDRLSEAEINPLFVMPEDEGVVAADGLVILT
ncbi:acetate--CoA ligase family protein [Roseivivax marinus]|uniref:acetate--CoA ligase family protein n=1 Tax=Roseivivax marinus TaxID=1379903 RepID=UPI001F04ECA2|nr:acetate--CoA ligase family protein [Roseivivax marinus]UMA64931.1 acetate--CoA ligase family protein [Roseivivax marinus]